MKKSNFINNDNKFDVKCIQQVVSLLEQFKMDECKETCPKEFIKEVVCSQKLFVETSKESIVYLFLRISSLNDFITSLLNELQIPINTRTIGKLCFVNFVHVTQTVLMFIICCVSISCRMKKVFILRWNRKKNKSSIFPRKMFFEENFYF